MAIERKKSNRITDLSDSAFLSFLYSERDRENTLNRIPGWSYWAIIGAWISVLCTAYYVFKESSPLNGVMVLYYTSAFLAIILSCGSFFRLLNIKRSVDYSRVRLLKEVIPVIHICFVFLCSVSLALLILLTDGVNLVFWLWIALLSVFSIALIIIAYHKDTIVPAFYFDILFPWTKANMFFEGIVSVLYVQIAGNSFRTVSGWHVSSEFELSVCLAGLMALMYLFFKIREKDETVLKIDEIIEAFLYMGVSKEETYHQLLINRCGHSVLDACQKELKNVEDKFLICSNDEKCLEEIKESIQRQDISLDEIDEFLKQITHIIDKQKDTVSSAEKLRSKICQVIKAAPVLRNVTELKYLAKTLGSIISKEDELQEKVEDVLAMARKQQRKIRSKMLTAINHSMDIIDSDSK